MGCRVICTRNMVPAVPPWVLGTPQNDSHAAPPFSVGDDIYWDLPYTIATGTLGRGCNLVFFTPNGGVFANFAIESDGSGSERISVAGVLSPFDITGTYKVQLRDADNVAKAELTFEVGH